jgi:hypothetical protein
MNKLVHLWNLPEKEVYVKFDSDFAKEFFDAFVKKFSANNIVKSLGLKSGMVLIKNYLEDRQSYPLFLIKEIGKLLENINKKFSLEEIEKHIIMIRSGNGNTIFNPRFPFQLNEKMRGLYLILYVMVTCIHQEE